MIIRGILDSSLNGQLCMRGFAPIKELARISKANYEYQRQPLLEQEETIREFLDTEKYLFFPEVILSYKVKHSFDDPRNLETPLQKIQNASRYVSSVDRTVLRKKKVDYKLVYDTASKNFVTILELELDDTVLAEYITNGTEPLHRIDGNHRLRAAEISESDKVSQMVAPFCILLGEEFYSKNIPVANDATEVFDKSVKIFFHNINTKTVPLTSEQNLRVIIDDEINFSDEEVEDILGPEGVKTRELIKKLPVDFLNGIAHIVNAHYRSYYIEVFRRLIHKGIDKGLLVDKVIASLKAVDLLYNENDKLKANSSFGLLTSFLYYHVEDNKAKYRFFIDWVLNNSIFEIPEIRADSIIKIFDKIAEKNISVFVAMPYYEGDADIMESFNQAYGRVINKIREAYSHVNISLFRIMQHRGKTRDIVENMINEIRSCSIFIADVTGGNPNVGYELGIARGMKKPVIILRRKADVKNVPFDYDHDVRNEYNHDAIHTLEEIVYENIIAILANEYGYILEADRV